MKYRTVVTSVLGILFVLEIIYVYTFPAGDYMNRFQINVLLNPIQSLMEQSPEQNSTTGIGELEDLGTQDLMASSVNTQHLKADSKDKTQILITKRSNVSNLQKSTSDTQNAKTSSAASTQNQNSLERTNPKSAQVTYSSPVFVLFSTWAPTPHKRKIYDNTLRMWNLFKPQILPLLYSEDEGERRRAESNGWSALPPPTLTASNSSCPKLPILRDMYLAAMEKFPQTELFGFCNGDLLLGAGLLDTMLSLAREKIVREKPVLLVLRRFNCDFTNRSDVHSFEEIAVLHGVSYGVMDGSSDAFFTNRLFPWHKIPDVVPGRLGVAMFLVSAARTLGVTVIDISPTAIAIHMTSSSGNLEAWKHEGSFCNRRLVEQLSMTPSGWGCGSIFCASWTTGRGKEPNATTRAFPKPEKLPAQCLNCTMDNITSYTAPKYSWDI